MLSFVSEYELVLEFCNLFLCMCSYPLRSRDPLKHSLRIVVGQFTLEYQAVLHDVRTVPEMVSCYGAQNRVHSTSVLPHAPPPPAPANASLTSGMSYSIHGKISSKFSE
jgi:hypothetical protein